MTLIAVGGAVNTMLLQSRTSTHDVDFFSAGLDNASGLLLEEAARAAEERSPVPLGGDWLNNSTTLFMARALRNELGQLAERQNDIVFRAPGLTVLAAPWEYAFCTKIDRMTKRNMRVYDCADAAAYLNRLIVTTNRGRPISAAFLQQRAAHYGAQAPLAQLQTVNIEYQKRFKCDGITM